MTPDPNPCDATACPMQTEPIETCRDHRCPHRWQREAREDRARREARDAAHRREQAASVSACVTTDCIGMANPIEECERTRCPWAGERNSL